MSISTNAARAAATLLELGQAGAAGTTLKNLSEAVGDPKPAMLRCLAALLKYGFVEQVARGRYRLGPAIYSLAKAESAVHLQVAKWRPALELLAEQLGQTMHLTRRAGMDVVVIDTQIGTAPVQMIVRGIGGRMPMGIGSSSLAIISTLDPEVRDELITANAERYQEFGLDTVKVTSYVEKAVIRGYSCDVGSVFPEVGGLAVPIRERGEYIAQMAIALTAPKTFFDTHDHGTIAAEIKNAISRIQGGLPLRK